ncbi:subclass B1 metallo-beta-lactamase [Leptospira ilyithenensis]
MFLFLKYLCKTLPVAILLFCFGMNYFCKSTGLKNTSGAPPEPVDSGLSDSDSIELIRVKENVWVHRSSGFFKGEKIPANGLIAVTSKGIVIVDTPWTEKQTENLILAVKEKFQKEISFVIITHAHADRITGAGIFIKQSVPVYSTSLTAKEAEKKGFPKPNPKLDLDPRMSLGDTGLEVYYPGQGHTKDNIVVWLPNTHILFTGCLVKSLESKSLGNIEDANLNAWPMTAKNLLERYPDAEIVVPGHGDWGKSDLIRHTIRLLNENSKTE